MITIGPYSFDEFLKTVESFHGAAAPGVLIGGFMTDLALSRLPEGILFDAISETPSCLPDAIQLLTPCTLGNGWLKVINLGRFALSLYNKYTGEGIRVCMDAKKLNGWPEVRNWIYKLKSKAEQDKEQLISQLREAGQNLCSAQAVQISPDLLKKRSKGRIVDCPLCGEPYPVQDGAVCRGCGGEAPYLDDKYPECRFSENVPPLRSIRVEESADKTALHDMTRIVPGKSKGAEFSRGQKITVGDICRLQQMGRQYVYVEEDNPPQELWVHENEAALSFAAALAGEGVTFEGAPREGKIDLVSGREGLFVVEDGRLEQFNMISGVMCASRRSGLPTASGRSLAGVRAIPLFLPRRDFERAMAVLASGPIFQVLPMRKARVGIIVTGTEVFQGLIEDKFAPIITSKVEAYGCSVVGSIIAPDDRHVISRAAVRLMEAGADLLVTTAGLSVDPDDVTRGALSDAGAVDMLYGAPILPGAMTLLARIGQVQVMGVPACALYFKTTSFDMLLPRLLAGLQVTRRDLARLGHGSFCLGCKACTFPKCPLGG